MKMRSIFPLTIPLAIFSFGELEAQSPNPLLSEINLFPLPQIKYEPPPPNPAFPNSESYLAGYKNAWERYVLTLKASEVSKAPGCFDVSIDFHSHCSGLSEAIAGMERGQGKAKDLGARLRGAWPSQKQELVAQLLDIQKRLISENRPPLPFCESHTYATELDREEALKAVKNEPKFKPIKSPQIRSTSGPVLSDVRQK